MGVRYPLSTVPQDFCLPFDYLTPAKGWQNGFAAPQYGTGYDNLRVLDITTPRFGFPFTHGLRYTSRGRRYALYHNWD